VDFVVSSGYPHTVVDHCWTARNDGPHGPD
jgi:hypothetical protein